MSRPPAATTPRPSRTLPTRACTTRTAALLDLLDDDDARPLGVGGEEGVVQRVVLAHLLRPGVARIEAEKEHALHLLEETPQQLREPVVARCLGDADMELATSHRLTVHPRA